MKIKLLFTLLLFSVFVFTLDTSAQINCNTNKILLNTGRNPASGNLIPIGQQDSMWKIISIQNTTGQAGYTLPYSPFVVNTIGSWWAPSNSRYLNKVNTVNETGGPNNTSIVMTRHFTTLQDDSFKVKTYFSVDNFVSSFKIDGINYFTSVTYSSTNNFSQQNLAIDDSIIYLSQGCHDITVTYCNIYPLFGNNPTGINIEGYIESLNGDSTLLKETCYQKIPPTLTANNILNYCSDCQLICPNLSITSGTGCANLTIAKVYFTSGYTAGQDLLQFIPQLGINSSFNTVTGVLTLTGNANYSVWETVLQTICYKSLVPNPANSFSTKNIVISLGDGLYNPANGHYYKLINTGSSITWNNARNACAISSYYGLQGYLVTITDSIENSFLTSLIQSETWIGANDSAQEGTWRWRTGCEGLEDAGQGRHFSTQNKTGSTTASPPFVINTYYNNWRNNGINSSMTEPNDWPCSAPGNHCEDYAHFLIGGSSNGKWNDYPNNQSSVTSYIIEYGCMPGDPIINLTGNVIVNIIQSTTSIINQSICQGQSYLGYTSQGTYIDTIVNSSGCDSIRILNLTVNPFTSNVTNATACNTYTWAVNSQTYTQSGTYIFTNTNASGCLHTETLNLTINNSTLNTTSITSCNTYTWAVNSQTYTQSGTYIFTNTNASGCLHTETLNLTINNSTSNTTNATACNTYTWTVNSQTYTQSGTYIFTNTNASGCLHAETLNLTINISNSNTTIATACDTYTWSVNLQTYTASGMYIFTSTNASGCLHTETLNLTINNSTSNTTSMTSCNTYTWLVNNQTYTQSGAYIFTNTNASGCLHTETLNLIINSTGSGTTLQTACDSFIWSCNNVIYTSTGNYTCTYINSIGCVHTQTLQLTIQNSNSASGVVSECDSYVWNGSTYTNSGTYTDTFTNVNGCDSVYTLYLTIQQSNAASSNMTVCDSYVWLNNVNYTSTGNYTDTFININGCDSVHTLNLTVYHSNSNSSNIISCNNYTWTNSVTYTNSGVYVDTFININGCDSIHTLNLTIHPTTYGVTNIIACDGYNWNGNLYTSSGIYTNTSINSLGCDSINTLNLTIHSSNTSSNAITSCDSYVWNSNTYITSGTYVNTFTNINGCDSVHTLNLTIHFSNSNSSTISSCDNYTWANNVNYTNSGIYTDTFTNVNGCDSIHILNLTVYHSNFNSSTVTACDAYTWIGSPIALTASGSYAATFTNAAGCDSIHTLNLIIHKSTSNTTTHNDCDSYTWLMDGNTYTNSGEYIFNDTNSNGCPHQEILKLNLNESTYSNIEHEICAGESYFGYTEPGHYIDTLTSKNGCDSIRTFFITKNIQTCCQFFIPNAFTPNDDGVNDEFGVVGEINFEKYELIVTNRWGQIGFKSSNAKIGWDGKFKGVDCPIGTYFYLVRYKCYGKNESSKKGDVTLIR